MNRVDVAAVARVVAAGGHPDAGQQPLAGLDVVELHAIGPVPFAGRVLASLGARVTRVSPPADPGLGVAVPPEHDLLNHGKQALHLNLKDDAGAAALRARLLTADVLLEGFRPGVLERLGLAPEALLTDNARLVVGRLSGWGAHGALAARAGHDINYLALAGVLHAIGTGAQPVPPLNLVADFGGGAMHLLVGVLARLVRRGMDGHGGMVETSILAGTHGLTPMFFGLIAAGQWRLDRADNLLDGAAPFYRCYATADGRQVAVGALEPKFYRELLDLLGLSGRLDARDQYRRDAWPHSTALFAEAIAARARDDWAAAAAGRDACLSPVLDFAEAAVHAHNRANDWFADGACGPRQVLRFS